MNLNLGVLVNKFKSDKKTALLCGLLLILFFYLDYSLLFKGQLVRINKLKPKISKLRKDITSLKKDLSALPELKKKQEQPGPKGKKIIFEDGVSGLMENIADIANKNGLRLMQIKPVMGKQKKDKGLPASGFVPLFLTLDLSVNYHDLIKFLLALENMDEFIAVESMKISPSAADQQKENVALVLRTYVKK